MLDLGQPEARAPQQHLAAVCEPLGERLRQAHHLGDAALHQHVHVERNAAFKLGELEQRFHHDLGIDRARARLEHDADVLGRFIAHVGDERQLLLVDQLGDALDQPALLHHPGNLGDHDEICAAAGFLLVPARAHPKRAAAGRIGFRNCFARVDHQPAAREIRAGNEFQERPAARVRIVDQEQRRVAQLGRIVRWDSGRHADRDAL